MSSEVRHFGPFFDKFLPTQPKNRSRAAANEEQKLWGQLANLHLKIGC